MQEVAQIWLAMWSVPRTISTAMMRSWENRPDTYVCDEPLYAHYLQVTGAVHPGADEVIRCHAPDWRKVVVWLTGPVPEGKRIFYQKHMAHHLLPQIGSEWLSPLTHCFLIRDPAEMLPSLLRILPGAVLADTGLPQQVALFDRVRRETGRTPPVVDAADVLSDPRGTLGRLCAAVGVPFVEAMLAWPPGRRPTDGIWAKYWYASVEESTGFRPPAAPQGPVPNPDAGLFRACEELYRQLYEARL